MPTERLTDFYRAVAKVRKDERQMAEKVKGCWVAFEEGTQQEAAEDIVNAIRMVRGVLAVTTLPEPPENWYVRQQVAAKFGRDVNELWRKLVGLAEEKK